MRNPEHWRHFDMQTRFLRGHVRSRLQQLPNATQGDGFVLEHEHLCRVKVGLYLRKLVDVTRRQSVFPNTDIDQLLCCHILDAQTSIIVKPARLPVNLQQQLGLFRLYLQDGMKDVPK